LIASLKAQNHEPDPPAWAAAAAIATSPQRRPRLPQKLPSDILTLQSKRHLNLVATTSAEGHEIARRAAITAVETIRMLLRPAFHFLFGKRSPLMAHDFKRYKLTVRIH
jgi:hypothetical protein